MADSFQQQRDRLIISDSYANAENSLRELKKTVSAEEQADID